MQLRPAVDGRGLAVADWQLKLKPNRRAGVGIKSRVVGGFGFVTSQALQNNLRLQIELRQLIVLGNLLGDAGGLNADLLLTQLQAIVHRGPDQIVQIEFDRRLDRGVAGQ